MVLNLSLAEGPLKMYNVYYRPSQGVLDINEVRTTAAQDHIIIRGDFYAHQNHTIITRSRKLITWSMCGTGILDDKGGLTILLC